MACKGELTSNNEQNIAAINSSNTRDINHAFKAETQEHEFNLPQGLEINLSTLKLTQGNNKVKDNINRYLEDFAIQALNFTKPNELEEEQQFYSLQDIVKANVQTYKNYIENDGDGWIDVWSIHQIYSLGFENEQLLIVEFDNRYNWGIALPAKPEKMTITFDLQNGKVLKTADIFLNKEIALSIIKDALAKEMLRIKNNPTQIQNSLSQIDFPHYLMIQTDNIHCIYSAFDGLPIEFGSIYVDIPLASIATEIKYL